MNAILGRIGRPRLAWSSGADKTTAVDRTVDIYHYDIGAEAGLSKPLGGRTVLRPFIGLGDEILDKARERFEELTNGVGHPSNTIVQWSAALRRSQIGVRHHTSVRLELEGHAHAWSHQR